LEGAGEVVAHWNESPLPELVVTALVPIDDVDWTTTLKRNFNYVLGDDENEIYLPEGVVPRIVAASYDGEEMDVPGAEALAP
jgi:hypothetical protein